MEKQVNFEMKGLSEGEVFVNRKKFGANKITRKGNRLIEVLKGIWNEPMLLILTACAVIYFALGEPRESIIMMTAISIIALISFFQERKSNKALKALREITSPHVEVIRNGTKQTISIEDLVKGDFVIIEEGKFVAADMRLVEANDISADESMLTGESFAVRKTVMDKENNIYKGSYLLAGHGKAVVEAVGDFTRLGKLGKDIQEIIKDKSPLQRQVSRFVKYMSVFGLLAFLFMWTRNYMENDDLLQSLLSGLTIAMSIFPEEIPVAITIFMALGAWEMVKQKVLIKDPQTLETLGSATIICVDKTGTLTENKMKVAALYSCSRQDPGYLQSEISSEDKEVLEYAMWASEPEPFDPMETAIHEAYKKYAGTDQRPGHTFIREYPLAGTPPAMTHVYKGTENNKIIVACKGGPETIFSFCKINTREKKILDEKIKQLALKGMRILAVAKAAFTENKFPENQKDFNWQFLGLIALSDPLKENIPDTIQKFYHAGVHVKMITGDIAETACSIARQAGIHRPDYVLTGSDLLQMQDEQFNEELKNCNVFARMLPEAKLKMVTRLKENGEIVCMTGDGINDAPALKASHIGIAMGKKGTQIAKESASIILMNDDLSQMIKAIAAGRKIYSNLKKAILYIISIHIPIIGIMIFPLLLRWKYETIFSPIHIVFFELLMGPICSVAYEKEPIEKTSMNRKPRNMHKNLFSLKELSGSIIQGLLILFATLVVLEFSIKSGYSENLSRSLVFITLIAANVFLALSDRSRRKLITDTIKIPNTTLYLLLSACFILLFPIMLIDFLKILFEVETPGVSQILVSLLAAFISVIWFEFAKAFNRKKAS